MGDRRWYRKRLGNELRLSLLTAVVVVCAGFGGTAFGQAPVAKTMLLEPPAPLLPATLGKLNRVAEGDSGDGLGSVDASDAAVLKEDGLKRFARSEYVPQVKGAAGSGTFTVYQFVDVSGAIAAFDYFEKPGQEHLDSRLVDQAACSHDCTGVLFRSGVNVVREDFSVHGDTLGALAHELIDHLPKAHGSTALPPLLPSLLPSKGLDAGSVKYALGPQSYQAMGGALPAQAMGFDKSGEAVTAKYKSGGVLTLLLYPTPEIAGDHVRAIQAAMTSSDAAAMKVRREGPLVAIATGAWPAEDAQKMVDGVHLRSEVSFDKPMPLEFHTELKKTYTLLQSIAIFSGVGALAAVVLGLFLGFGRAGIRVLQGKPAATEPEFLRIDLRGAPGKRLRNPE